MGIEFVFLHLPYWPPGVHAATARNEQGQIRLVVAKPGLSRSQATKAAFAILSDEDIDAAGEAFEDDVDLKWQTWTMDCCDRMHTWTLDSWGTQPEAF